MRPPLRQPRPGPRAGRQVLLTLTAVTVPLAGASFAEECVYEPPPPAVECATEAPPAYVEPEADLHEALEPDDLTRSKTDAELRAAAPGPLSGVKLPSPADDYEYIRDKKAAIALGKALFWDMRVGSQGQACASCHFQAGADPRAKNQLSPGLLADDPTFQPTGGGGGGGPNYTLKKADFPFHRKVDPRKNDEYPDNTKFDTNDVASSQGVRLASFVGLTLDPLTGQFIAVEAEDAPDPTFKVGPQTTRRVEPRNTPTVINAVFNHRNFWDGRANFVFNGLDPFGRRSNVANPDQGLYRLSYSGPPYKVQVEIPYASLASQAVGPSTNPFEMSAGGKRHADIGRLLLRHYGLSLQSVHCEDSALAAYRRSDGQGLWITYDALIQRAFHPRWWAHRDPIVEGGASYTQKELNFSLFFGLAVQLYEATLVSSKNRYQSFMQGDGRALTHEEKFGLEVFLNQGRCINCHSGPTFSGASTPVLLQRASGSFEQPVERMEMARGVAVYDAGFYNIGVRPTTDDAGVGGDDPFGNPLAFSQQLSNGRLVDRFLRLDPSKFEVDPCVPVQRGERTAVKGAFKVPTLLNVELTAPFMHNGGMLTLEQVVEFYARGGDFHRANLRDLDPDIRPIRKLNGKPRRIKAVAAFLRTLTDDGVRNECAPFDHPSLVVVNGNVGDEVACSPEEELLSIPAVGRRGRRAYYLPPITPFLGGY